MYKFRPLLLEDRHWLESCRNVTKHPFTALSFQSLFTWRQDYQLSISGDSSFFVIHSVHDDAYFCPCGEEDSCNAFLHFLQTNVHHPRLLYLTESQSRVLKSRGWEIRLRPDLSEYIYYSQGLAARPGFHITGSYKHKIINYQKQIPYSARFVQESDLPLLREIVARSHEQQFPYGFEIEDIHTAYNEIDHFISLGLQGVLLHTQDDRYAFLLGYENSPDMFTMSIAKYEHSLPRESTALVIHELARLVCDRYPYTNLEEDLGIEGLRRTKLLYSPIQMLDVYEAIYGK